jgi:hypothetical protein
MIDTLKNSGVSTTAGISTATIGFFNTFLSRLPFMHDLLAVLSMVMGIFVCLVVLIVNLRQAHINLLKIREMEKRLKNEQV